MSIKARRLSDSQLTSFHSLGSSMGSLATLPLPGTYLTELKDCGINEREYPRNELVGCVVTQPSGSQLAVETVFFDKKDEQDNGDLHVINFKSKTVTSYYCGWGTWTEHYGNKHHEYKDYLRCGSSHLPYEQDISSGTNK